MKEIKFVYVGKAKDFNVWNVTLQSVKKIKLSREEEIEANNVRLEMEGE